MSGPNPVEPALHYLVDAVSDYAIYMLDPQGSVTSWNTGARRLKGYAEAEIRGRPFSQFFTPEDRAAGMPQDILDRAARDGRVEVEGWRLRKDGSRFWTQGTIHAVREPGGALIGFAKVTRDMTERKAAQEALAASERQFRLLVSGVVDYAIFMLDPAGIVTNWNAGAQNIKGYAVDEIVGRHFSVFYTEEDRAAGAPHRALATAAEQGRYEAEGWRVRKDGSLFWALAIIDAIKDETGALIGFAKITRDNTEKRRAELELQRAHEQLAQAQKLEALGKLTGGVAHDFNNLLMVVSGQAQLLRRKVGEDARALRALDAIEASARRGEDLTRALLSFSRRQRLVLSPTALPERADGLKELLSASLPPAVRLDLDLPEDLWPVTVDVGELELALLNLAVNARDAMPDGGSLSIGAANVTLDGSGPGDLAGDFVAVSLQDTGTGIAPDILPRIFDPFFTTKDVDKGTGLGLSQVFGFAQQSGGHVTVDSDLGKGTCFTLYLPRADQAPRSVADDAPLPPASSARILLVEDNPDVADVAARMLEELGHEVRTVSSGTAALGALGAGEAPDLIFSDIVMAGDPDGLGLARRVREAFPHVPILLATGYSEAAARIGDEFPILRKPYKLAELSRALSEQLAAHRPSKLVDLETERRARGVAGK
ncbi:MULTISPECIES: PAS domain-containing sensor histidine kinase [unclassified Phenylobacterium]|uniref:hybrid sensor histidine kinase/response regulator n=1 Tax=unclassified Phenylobacterium TaxID=2640670 RepID=UPI00083B1A28|nr:MULTISPECIES: PAS domain-containing sensor histidine kinase [unclassified Phenylobacterium]